MYIHNLQQFSFKCEDFQQELEKSYKKFAFYINEGTYPSYFKAINKQIAIANKAIEAIYAEFSKLTDKENL